MAIQFQNRRGTVSENNSFTGAAGEVVVDTTNNRLRVHDGVTEGGFPIGDVINVKDFGAVGDGVADDTVAIQNSISQGSAIYIPKGTYRCTDIINIPSDRYIYGDFKATKIYFGYDGQDNPDGFSIVDGSNISIENLVIGTDATHEGYSAGWAAMGNIISIYAETKDIQSLTFSNLIFENGYNGISFQRDPETKQAYTTSDFKVSNCSFYNMWFHGIATRYTNNAQIANCYFYETQVGLAVDFSTGTRNSVMTNCTADKTVGFIKVQSDYLDDGEGTKIADIPSYNVLIDSCIYHQKTNSLEHAVKFDGANCTLSNCKIYASVPTASSVIKLKYPLSSILNNYIQNQIVYEEGVADKEAIHIWIEYASDTFTNGEIQSNIIGNTFRSLRAETNVSYIYIDLSGRPTSNLGNVYSKDKEWFNIKDNTFLAAEQLVGGKGILKLVDANNVNIENNLVYSALNFLYLGDECDNINIKDNIIDGAYSNVIYTATNRNYTNFTILNNKVKQYDTNVYAFINMRTFTNTARGLSDSTIKGNVVENSNGFFVTDTAENNIISDNKVLFTTEASSDYFIYCYNGIQQSVINGNNIKSIGTNVFFNSAGDYNICTANITENLTANPPSIGANSVVVNNISK